MILAMDYFNIFRFHTWNSGAEELWIPQKKIVLQSPSPHTLGANQNQSFPLERWDLGHLLVEQDLMSVEL